MDNTSRKKLHNLLVSENLYTKSFDDFEKQFSNPESQKKLHGLLVEEDLYTKPETEFYTQFFGDAKKKNPSTPTEEVISVSGESASPSVPQQKGSILKSPTQGESQGLLLLDPSKKKSKFDYTNPVFFAPKGSVTKDVNYFGKALGSKSKDLSIKQSDLKKRADLLSKQYDELNAYIELNPNDPSVNAKVAALENQKALLNKESETVNQDVTQLNQDAKGLNKLVTQNYAEKAKQGNWGGALWNSVVTGYEKYGQGVQRSTIDLGIELLDLMGFPYASKQKESELRNKVIKESKGKLTEDQIKSKVKDLSKKEVINEFKPILKKGYEGIKSEGTTEEFIQEKKKSGDIAQAVLGVAESVPMMASGGYGRFATGAMQMYANLNEEMDNNPETASMDENERKKITLPIAIVSGFLEDFGFRNVLGKGTPLLSRFTSMVLAQVPKNATLGAIELATKKVAESAVGKMLLKGGTTAAKGYLSEFETGGLQSGAEIVTKEIYDYAKDIDLFKNPEIFSGEFLDKVVYDAHVEGLGGLIMSGTIAGAQKALSGKQMGDADFEEWRNLMLDDNHITATLANLQVQFMDGKITYDQFSESAKDLGDSRKILQEIPNNLSAKGQREAFSLIAQNQKVQKEIDDLSAYMADKNPQLVKNIAAEIESKQAIINKNNEQLSKIPENAIQEQTTSEVPVQPEAGVSGEVAKGEPKAEPKVPSEEVKAEEIGDNTEDITIQLERLSTDNKMQYVGNDMPIMGNEAIVAEQYLQAKQDGSNPELVSTVESLINKDAAEKKKQIEDAFAGITKESVQQAIKEAEESKKPAVKISEAVDKPKVFTLDGKRGSLYTEENGTVVFESDDRITELGNINEIQDKLLRELGLSEEAPLDIAVNDDNSVTIEGNTLQNNYSDPMAAINYDENGNVVSVNLDTDNNQKRTIRGQRAQEIAYQYTLKNFEQNATEQDIDEVIGAIQQTPTSQGVNEQVTGGPTVTVTEEVQPEKVVEQTKEEETVRPEKSKKAPSAKNIVGKDTSKKVTINEVTGLKEKLRVESKAAKSGFNFAEKARKLINDYVKKNIEGALSKRDLNILFNALGKKLDTVDARKKFIEKVNSILKGSLDKIAINELDALKTTLKAEAKGARVATKAVQTSISNAVAKIKSLQKGNKLTQAQANVLLNGLKSNLMNPTVRENFFNRVERVLDNAEYAAKIAQANDLRSKIKTAIKSDTVVDDIKIAAKALVSIRPGLVEDIDEYIDYAEQVFNAVRGIKVVNGEVLTRRAAVLSEINDYVKEQKDIQDEINKNILLDQYQYLVDAKLIDDTMSLEAIKDYISSVEENVENAESTKSEIVKAYTKNAFEGFSDVVRDMMADGEIDELDADFDLINNFLNMDIEALPLDQQLAAVNALENLIVNGITTQMGAVYKSYVGVTNAEKDLNAGLVAQPLIYGLVGRVPLVGKIYSSLWGRYVSKVDSLVVNMFRSTAKGIKFLRDSGFSGIVKGFVDGKSIANKFAEKYSERFKGSRPNNQDFYTAYNAYERGIFADLSRNILNGTPEQVKEEFNRKMDQLRLTIEELRKTKDSLLGKKAELYDQVYQKIKDKKDIDEVKKEIDPINQTAVQEFQNEWKKYYPEFKRMAADYYGIVLDEDVNYTPEMYEKLSKDTTSDLLTKGSFKMNFDAIKTERVGTLQKSKKITGLPKSGNEVSRVRDYDFDSNNIRALERTIIDVRTTPFVQQYMGYVNSDAFKEMIPDYNQRQMIKDRLAFNIDALRERSDTSSLYETKLVAKGLSAISRIGTKIGLGSMNAAVKQSLPMTMNTLINTIDDPQAYLNSFADYMNDDAIKALNESGYGISLRGAESQTSIDYAENLIERNKNKNVNQLVDAASNVSDFYIETFLKKPDVFVAKVSWFAYYRKKLKDLGLDTNIDWKTHEINEEAADYAEYMVQDQQNMNVSELGGKLLASKNPTTKIIRQLLFPFASYQFNLKDKNARNITILTSKNSNIQDKAVALQSLASGIAESYIFEWVQRGVQGLLLAGAYASLGGDDRDEEDKLLDEQFKDKIFYGKLVNEFAFNLPEFVSDQVLLKLNSALDIIEGGTPDEQLKAKKEAEKEAKKNNAESFLGKKLKGNRKTKKTLEEKELAKKKESLETPFRFYVKDPKEGEGLMSLVGGVPNVAYETLVKIYQTYQNADKGYFTDKYGNKTEYTEDQKKELKLSLIPRVITASTLGPREFLSYGTNIEKIVNKQALMNKKKAKEEKSKSKSNKKIKF